MKMTEKQELKLYRTQNKYGLLVKKNKSGNIYFQTKNGVKFSGNAEVSAINALFSDKDLQDAIKLLISQLD